MLIGYESRSDNRGGRTIWKFGGGMRRLLD